MKSFIRSAACPSRRFHGLLIQSVFTALCLVLLLTLRPACADELSDARSLFNSGKPAEALAIADAYLAQKPNDAHMLFLKGLILTQQDQSAKAIAVFAKRPRNTQRCPNRTTTLQCFMPPVASTTRLAPRWKWRSAPTRPTPPPTKI